MAAAAVALSGVSRRNGFTFVARASPLAAKGDDPVIADALTVSSPEAA